MIAKLRDVFFSLFTKWTVPFLLSCILFLLVKFFLYDFKIVEKNSMEGTLKEGDIVLMKKINYPLKPSQEIHHNDIIIFNDPSEQEILQKNNTPLQFIKRCIGLPGDTIQSINNTFICNGVTLKNPKNNKLTFKAEFNNDDSVLYLLNENGIKSALKTDNKKEWIFNATKDKALKIAGKLDVEKFQEINLSEPTSQPFFLSNIYPNWNIDNYGPLYIPKKGDSIDLNLENVSIYASIISSFENNILSVRNDSLLINGIFKNYYCFKQNYYFAIGDNRYNSYDSRFIGFIPEVNLLGTVPLVVCSYNTSIKSFRTNRFLINLHE